MRFDYKVFSAVIGIGYIIIGILVIIDEKFFVQMEKKWSVILGALFIVYGLFRVYRAAKYIQQKKKSNE